MDAIDPKRLQQLIDHQDIERVLVRYCRGLDRMDKALTLSCWHSGGTDDHAPLFSGSAEGFVDWLWPVHAAMISTRHEIFNIQIESDGKKAGTECYYRVFLEIPDGDDVLFVIGSGRYVDNFEKRDGVWAIRHRQMVSDWVRVAPTRPDLDARSFIEQNNPEAPPTIGKRSPEDYSYGVLQKFTK
jgi:hypothetical protein